MMKSPTKLTFAELRKQVQLALRQWHSTSKRTSPLASLRIYQQLRQKEMTSEHEVTNLLLYQCLQLLKEQNTRDEHILRRSVVDGKLNDMVAIEINVANSTFYRYKKNAVTRIAEILWMLEHTNQDDYQSRLLARLAPPSNNQLLGIEKHVQSLVDLLTNESKPWIVSISGMGGIGKTTLADAVVRAMITRGQVQELGWVTAKQSVLQWHGKLQQVEAPALTLDKLAEELCTQLLDERMTPPPNSPRNAVTLLRGALKARPHLVVIDNLETVADIESLVDTLRELAMPTKFLLTSRESLFHQPEIHHYAVPELDETLAIDLIRKEAQARNLVPLQQASDQELLPIVDAAGGNPLALRLIVGQTYIHPLPVILENLKKARGEHIENLYTYIYRQSWDRLDEISRSVLVAMPLVPPSGAELSQLVQISQIAEDQIVRALDQLVRINLVDVRGDLYQRRYSIHNLTRTFLHEQVLQWA